MYLEQCKYFIAETYHPFFKHSEYLFSNFSSLGYSSSLQSWLWMLNFNLLALRLLSFGLWLFSASSVSFTCILWRTYLSSFFWFGYNVMAVNGKSKLLLAAKRIRRSNFVISLAGDDFSQASNKYVCKLRYVLVDRNIFLAFYCFSYTSV